MFSNKENYMRETRGRSGHEKACQSISKRPKVLIVMCTDKHYPEEETLFSLENEFFFNIVTLTLFSNLSM